MKEEVKQTIKEIVGSENYTEELIDIVSFSHDSSETDGRPFCAVWPTCTEEVSKIAALAFKERIPLVARGAGTGLAGSAVPVQGGIVLDLSRMDKILEINLADRAAVVQPGVVYADLDKALAPYGFFYPPEPASGKVATLGGNVATGAGGLKGAKYGTTRDYVLALEVVLADGRVMRVGRRCMKSVSGYDFTRLMVGSEGTLGIFTEITLKINPRPQKTATSMAAFGNVTDAGEAVTTIMSMGVIPAVLEIIDRATISAINKSTDLNLPDAAAILLAETDGSIQAEVDDQMDRIVKAFEKHHAFLVKRAATREEAENLWAGRRMAYAVATKIKPTVWTEDLAVPLSQVPYLLQTIEEISKKYDIPIPTCGHAGDGNLHPIVAIDRSHPGEVERAEEGVRELLTKACQCGGTLTGEHGIGLTKAEFLPLEHGPVNMEFMRGLKKLFDPLNILNPGKMSLDG